MDNRIIYEDGKYCMQDVGTLYIGTKYRFAEILEDENIPFKFRLLTDRYLLPQADPEDTLETHLYYLEEKGVLLKIYGQLRAKVKVNVLEDKKKLGGTMTRAYVTKTLTVSELASIPKEEKERIGLVVQELSVSKFALMGF